MEKPDAFITEHRAFYVEAFQPSDCYHKLLSIKSVSMLQGLFGYSLTSLLFSRYFAVLLEKSASTADFSRSTADFYGLLSGNVVFLYPETGHKATT